MESRWLAADNRRYEAVDNKDLQKSILTEPVYYLLRTSVSQEPLENMFASVRYLRIYICVNNRINNDKKLVGALRTCYCQ